MTDGIITSAWDLVNELWGNAPYGNVWVKQRDGASRSTWFAISGEAQGVAGALPLARFNAETARLAQRVGADVYFGVHPVSAIPPGPGARTQAAIVHSARCLFGDFDRKDYAGIETNEALAEKIVADTWQAPPSVIVDTGGGIHAYWLLEHFVLLTDAVARAEHAALQARWVRAVGADPGAKDLARVLRLPGTLNQKYAPAPTVKIIDGNGIRYSLDVLRRMAAPAPTVIDLGSARHVAATTATTPAEDRTDVHADAGSADERPGDYFNAHHGSAALVLLLENGWVIEKEDADGALYLTRPGKGDGVSASWGKVAPGVLHVFSSNAHPFEADKSYSAFGVFALLAHNGDYAEAARTIRQTMMPSSPTPGAPTGRGHADAGSRSAPGAPPTPGAPTGRGHADAGSRSAPGAPTPSAPVKREGITLAELRDKHFDPQVWVVAEIAPEGVVLIAAKPKKKKSWLALGLSLAIANGTPALGRYRVRQGDVLYLDLEGNQRRIKNRVQQMLQGPTDVWPDNVVVHTEWGRDDAAIAEIRQWLTDTPKASAVVVDLLHEIRRPIKANEDRYAYDRDMLVKLNRLAEEFHVAIFVVHHTRKMKGEDVFEEISGSLGLVGAVTTSWVLSTGQDGHPTLNIQGRDLVRDDPLAMKWDPQFCTFTVIGTEAEAAMSDTRRRVYDALRAGITTTAGIIAETGMIKQTVNNQLTALVAEGIIARTPGERGQWQIIAPKRAAATSDPSTPAADRRAGNADAQRAYNAAQTAPEAPRRAEAPKPTTTTAAPAAPIPSMPAAPDDADADLFEATTPAAPAAPDRSAPSSPTATTAADRSAGSAPAPDEEAPMTPTTEPRPVAPDTMMPALTPTQRAWHDEGADMVAVNWWRRHARADRADAAQSTRIITIRRGRTPSGREQYLVCDHSCFGLLRGTWLWGYATEDKARAAAHALGFTPSPIVSSVALETADWYAPVP